MNNQIYNLFFVQICHTNYGFDLEDYCFPKGIKINQVKYHIHGKSIFICFILYYYLFFIIILELVVERNSNLFVNTIDNPDKFINGAIRSIQNRRYQKKRRN